MSKKEAIVNVCVFFVPLAVGVFVVSVVPFLREGGSGFVIVALLMLVVSISIFLLTRQVVAAERQSALTEKKQVFVRLVRLLCGVVAIASIIMLVLIWQLDKI